MADFDKLEKGTQVVYVPNHANGRLDHPNSEEGFVTSVRDGGSHHVAVFCRFWSKYQPRLLRTRANSELCFPHNLVVKDTRPQSEVDAKLAEIEGAPAGRRKHSHAGATRREPGRGRSPAKGCPVQVRGTRTKNEGAMMTTQNVRKWISESILSQGFRDTVALLVEAGFSEKRAIQLVQDEHDKLTMPKNAAQEMAELAPQSGKEWVHDD